MLRQNLSQKMLQKLSPQQIQLMKLLQIPTATLEQRIQEELEANPALEEGMEAEDPFDNLGGESDSDSDFEEPEREIELDEYLSEFSDDDVATYKLKANNYSKDDEDKEIPIRVEDTLHEYLERQLGMMEFEDDEEETIAYQVIGTIDLDGYLRRDAEAMVDDLMFTQNMFTRPERIDAVIKRVQQLDPPGIAARDLRECLLLQLQRIQKNGTSQSPEALEVALRLVGKYFDEFSKKHYSKLQRQLNVSEAQLKDAIDEVLKCNPKPASAYSTASQRNMQYVIPDFTIVNRDGELELETHSRNAPDLRVSDQYRDMLKGYDKTRKARKPTRGEKEAVMFIKQKIDSARWFIDAIRQRQETMLKTMYAILRYQYDYFLTGDQRKMKPMILKDIAEMTGLDISTVSRVANSKYVQTEFGTKRLKDFFSESLQTDSGEEVSTLEVKRILQDIIEDENKRKPLSDEKLKNILRDRGYNIARRTVAKYREQLNIPVARLRKELS